MSSGRQSRRLGSSRRRTSGPSSASRTELELGETAYVILCMLRMGIETGYQIKQFVDVSTRFFWAASYSQIYPELRRLERLKLIEGKSAPRGGRRRTVYRVLPAGERALKSWLTSGDLSSEIRETGLLKFFFADLLTDEEVLGLLREWRRHHEVQREELRQIAPASQALPFQYPYRSLTLGIEFHGWLIEWCREMERRIARDGEQG